MPNQPDQSDRRDWPAGCSPGMRTGHALFLLAKEGDPRKARGHFCRRRPVLDGRELRLAVSPIEYYSQRASAGLIVNECTEVSDQAHGVIRAPGLHRPDQISAWREITDTVHAAVCRIHCQIWHCGRVAHPDMRGGEPPVGPSPIPATGEFVLPTGRVEFPVPRVRCASTKSPASSPTSPRPPATPARPASTASNCTGRMAISRTSSCRMEATSGPMPTADRSRTGRG